ncbi:MAG: hypothetical protein FJ087_04660 [Deltaproteobacteria bacterium]|nr:hypothetical protein [Deltaproteobacteria bacterium]
MRALRLLSSVAAAAGVFAATASDVPASARIGNDYGVFCVKGRLVLDQRRIEELKSAYGSDVCRLDQDATEAGAREKASRLGGAGASCTCE